MNTADAMPVTAEASLAHPWSVTADALLALTFPDATTHPAKATHTGHQAHINRERGMTYIDSRAYVSGDDPRLIDWRQSARQPHWYTRELAADRGQRLWLWPDLGPSMRFASRGVFKSAIACAQAVRLAHSAIRSGCEVGVLAAETPPLKLAANGHALPLLCHHLAYRHAQPHQAPLMQAHIAAMLAHLRPGDALCLLSDLIHLEDTAITVLSAVAERCQLSVHWITDPLDRQLPALTAPTVIGWGQRIRSLAPSQIPAVNQALASRRRQWLNRLAMLPLTLFQVGNDTWPGIALDSAVQGDEYHAS